MIRLASLQSTERADCEQRCGARKSGIYHHHITGPYLNAYASPDARRKDNRRVNNCSLHLMAADTTLKSMSAPLPKRRSFCAAAK
jgi:hypothetical protein